MSTSKIGPYDNGPCKWVAAAAGQTRYPTDDQGGGTATAGSAKVAAPATVFSHIIVTSDVNAGDKVEIVDLVGTTIPGLSFTLDAGQKVIPLNVEYLTGTTSGLKCTSCDATLFYR